MKTSKKLRILLILVIQVSALTTGAQTVTITSSIPSSLVPGSNFNIDFATTGTYKSTNVFTAQLSDSLGSFVAPTGIGSLKSTKSGTIPCIVPSTIISSSGYKIRIWASQPIVYSASANATIAYTNGVPFQTLKSPLDSLANVNISSPSSGQALIYNAGTGKWVNSAVSGGGVGVALALDSLTDVTVSTPASKDVLKYNGTAWVNSAAVISDITGLQDSLNKKLTKNTAISGDTKTKITYDANGLVTAGADAAVADVTGLQDSLNKKLTKNTAISGDTKTKITYDANGLVTASDSASLTDLRGVSITSPTNNQVLTYNGSTWVNASSGGSYWSLTGNSGLVASTNFIGTTDAVPLVFKMKNVISGYIDSASNKTGFGYYSLGPNTTGAHNTAFGSNALRRTTTGYDNTAVGSGALAYQSTGNSNTAVGKYAAANITSGSDNTALGFQALPQASSAKYNTAVGSYCLYANTAWSNTAVGYHTANNNTSGSNIVAVGYYALDANQTGSDNVAVGYQTLMQVKAGYNTAIGSEALRWDTLGANNTSMGYQSLYYNRGKGNTASGYLALYNSTTGNFNSAFGDSSLFSNTTGSFNTAIGHFANVNAGDLTNATAIGSGASVDASNKVRIGNASVTVVESQGTFSSLSDGRYKKNVKEDAPGLSLILKLRPVTYNFEYTKFSEHLKEKNADKAHLRQRESKKEMGFVAQEVEKALKDAGTDVSNLVNVPQNTDGYYTLSYSELVVPLVKAVQEQQKTIEELKKTVEALQEQSPTATIGGTAAQTATVLEMPEATTLLGQNIPNPFDTKTIIPFRLQADCNSAAIVITNVTTGQIIRAIPVSNQETQLSLDASKLPSGSYAYSLYVNGKAVDTKKMTMVR